MKRAFLLCSAIACAFLLASCAERAREEGPAEVPRGIPEELREIMRANVEATLPAFHPDFEEAWESLSPDGYDLETDEAIAAILADTERRSPTAIIRMAAIEEELHFLFDLLRYAYAGYNYFGGDGVFLPLRDAMLERARELTARSGFMSIDSYRSQILALYLRGVIADNHFHVERARMAAPNYVQL
ncbi:MAG: hypothetical protein FWE09_02475, partial [Treponema sp.]|nr:hypothetical protein [Treponema sp.]